MEPDANVLQKHWLMFLIRPDDLLRYYRLLTNDSIKFAASDFPPDTHVVDVYYSAERDYFVLVLESDLFDPVEVTSEGGGFAGAWNEVIFTLDEAESAEAAEEQGFWTSDPPAGGTPEPAPRVPVDLLIEEGSTLRVCVFWFSGEQVLSLLRVTARNMERNAPYLPEDAKIINALIHSEGKAVGLALHSNDFEPAPTEEMEDGGTRFLVPEEWLELTVTPAPEEEA